MAALLLLALLIAGPLQALDSLRVGSLGQRWDKVMESSRFISVASDSVWIWPAPQYTDLAPQSLARTGSIRARVLRPVGPGGALGPALADKPGLDAWIDNDPGSAWSPEEDNELSRQAEVYLDLGATFRVNRIRFYPRLDGEHLGLVLGSFDLATSDGTLPVGALLAEYKTLFGFTETFPNRQTVVDRQFPTREVRYLRLSSLEKEQWEIAGFEVYSEGSLPAGEFVSSPLFVRGGSPVWGQVRLNGGDLGRLPVTVQTRTGPDEEPLLYYIKRGDELERVSQQAYDEVGLRRYTTIGIVEEEQGPVLPNPQWSPWQTVSDGLVLSPGPQRYLQFRLLFSEPGLALRDLIFEYVRRPLATALEGEISPLEVEPGVPTRFTLSLEMQFDQGRRDTGVRYLQILTPAVVSQVERVLVDDEEVVFSAAHQPGEGFTLDLWQRVVQAGSFVQVVFDAAVFRDGTPFLVRAVDLRPEEGGLETVYQTVREGDVDPFSVGGQLVVRFRTPSDQLVRALNPGNTLITPNGDGINDFFTLAYGLFMLIRPAPVILTIFDLQGHPLRRDDAGSDLSGSYTRLWDGTDNQGRLVPPGIYLYQIEVRADTGTHRWQGTVEVAY
ncbi:MAG: gliding motility-associated C-terminal domain-containing protein [Candidatus Latescibacteria bacterium]|nr:gliding motility-associated C-terminal domain-containing protein [Candidatus Latescibacterota bacterium]